MLTLGRELRARAVLLGAFVGAIWATELVDLLFLRGGLDYLGIRPRDTSWLWGILLAPFLHGGMPHLLANTGPLLILGGLVLLRRRLDYVIVTVIVTLVGGFAVWLLAPRNTVHLGASGVAFGYLGYLIARTWFERSLTSLAIALVAGFLYSGALFGVLPGQRGVSWEGHLFGLIAGGATGAVVKRPEKRLPAGDPYARYRPPTRSPVS
jgi:membrane associated rhomboid family serine protease